jgi:hypothetical protein
MSISAKYARIFTRNVTLNCVLLSYISEKDIHIVKMALIGRDMVTWKLFHAYRINKLTTKERYAKEKSFS